METVVVSPMEFVAVAEKTTFAERFASMLDGRGVIHDGKLYVVTPAIDDDAVTSVERDAARKRAVRINAPLTKDVSRKEGR